MRGGGFRSWQNRAGWRSSESWLESKHSVASFRGKTSVPMPEPAREHPVRLLHSRGRTQERGGIFAAERNGNQDDCHIERGI